MESAVRSGTAAARWLLAQRRVPNAELAATSLGEEGR
jgi:hypothetical protein